MKELKDLIDVCQKINRDCHISGKITAQGHIKMILATGAAAVALKRATVFEGIAVDAIGHTDDPDGYETHVSTILSKFFKSNFRDGEPVTIIVIPKEADNAGK